MNSTDLIGWSASAILIATISRQVYKQWREGGAPGLSRWMFVGQITASLGFVLYSYLLRNWVFVTTNSLLLLAAIVGEILYLRGQRRKRDAA